jgi:pimeloyl-ACP methyl ester carboxylesterase
VDAALRSRRVALGDVELDVREAGPPDGPPVILAHGFPESSWSWRHQLPALGAAGYHVLAPDQRGYGRSSCPTRVEDYGIENLAGDLVALLDETGHEQGVFVGHDWGALIVWDLARLHPERVRAVVGVSVPYTFWPERPTDTMRARAGDRFFYILYFQPVGPAERELEADVRHTLLTTFWSACGEGFQPRAQVPPMAGTGFLTGLPEPPPLPWPWLDETDLDTYADAFEASGFFGPVSYYRNFDANYERLRDVPPSVLTMPSLYVTGEEDPVRRMSPRAPERMAAEVPGFRGQVLLPGVGHWTQQEAPAAFNEALLAFLATV